jgi:hypothetical protein
VYQVHDTGQRPARSTRGQRCGKGPLSERSVPLRDGRECGGTRMTKRSKHQRERDRQRSAQQLRDLVIVAGSDDGVTHTHPSLLAERVASDHPLISDPIRPHVLTHDHSGAVDE